MPLVAGTRRANSVLKILLIAAIVVAGAVLIGGGLIGYKVYSVARSARNSISTDDKGRVSVTTANGSITSSEINASAADLGVPLYPGATPSPGGVHVRNPGGAFLTASFKTPDDVETVARFYRTHLPDADETTSSSSHVIVFKSGTLSDHSMISITPISEADNMSASIVVMHTQSNTQP